MANASPESEGNGYQIPIMGPFRVITLIFELRQNAIVIDLASLGPDRQRVADQGWRCFSLVRPSPGEA
jgi:hypothetical protein